MIEFIGEFMQSVSVDDKKGYEKRITECVKFFIDKNISQPTEEDWQACIEFLKGDGERSDRTIRLKYIPAAKKFYRWYSSQATTAMTTETHRAEKPIAETYELELFNTEIEPSHTERSEPETLSNAEPINDTHKADTPIADTELEPFNGAQTETETAMTEHEKPKENTTKAEKQSGKDKQVRINFLLDERRYKKLSIMAVLENTSLTALLKEGADLCIAAHETQAAIAEQAINTNETAKSN